MTDLYDELGVPRDATPEDIKRAYKRKAREHHPDRGGDNDQMARVNQAYAVLADPRKRDRYDKTGDGSPEVPVAERARNLLYAIMSEALTKCDTKVDVIESLRQHLRGEQMRIKAEVQRVRQRQERLEKHKARLHDDGLFERLFDARSKEHALQTGQMRDQLELISVALQQLKSCSYDAERSPGQWHTVTTTGTGTY